MAELPFAKPAGVTIDSDDSSDDQESFSEGIEGSSKMLECELSYP
jgi:hypothetical protein